MYHDYIVFLSYPNQIFPNCWMEFLNQMSDVLHDLWGNSFCMSLTFYTAEWQTSVPNLYSVETVDLFSVICLSWRNSDFIVPFHLTENLELV
jgi:hypothetical protein